MKKIWHIGDIINNFELIENLKGFNNRNDYWKVKCSCNNILILRIDNIINRKKCNCNNISKNCLLLNQNNKSISSSFYLYKYKAKERNYDWNLNIDEFYNIIIKNCHYCNNSPSNVTKSKDQLFIQSGIDRVDNTLGYDIKNCVPCCKDCNRAKSDKTLNEFKEWIINLYNNTIKITFLQVIFDILF